MSIWNKITEAIGLMGVEADKLYHQGTSYDVSRYAFIDAEVSSNSKKVCAIGSIRWDGANLHTGRQSELIEFLKGIDYICGHNIIHHDMQYLFGGSDTGWRLVDTLYVSPLLFPDRPYHKLLKNDKLLSDQMNNPVNDCQKAKDLLNDEIAHWRMLPKEKQAIYASLLYGQMEFQGFLYMVGAEPVQHGLPKLIQETYAGKVCEHADFKNLITKYPCELAYALALIDTTDQRSLTPSWVLYNYPRVEKVVKLLRHTHCKEGCAYCNTQLDVVKGLRTFFGYRHFRTYNGEPLQEKAAQAAVDGKSVLAIFPTGGGKSLTFQLPALMAYTCEHGLTVVISPLQSLMKDQVDNLAERGITSAVTINGLLDPISRAQAIEQVVDGSASLLYIAPEMLRSNTIEKILLGRHVVRFVIDEAHCFSSWGQDFRVDYLYIAKFIRRYQEKKNCDPIPVSCFTATAKQKVIQDICDYFKEKLAIRLRLFTSSATRTNLRYSVIHTETDSDKYIQLRGLIAEANCPSIIYVSRTKRTKELSDRLKRDGYPALPFHGRMDADEKIANQEAFMSGKVNIIVATSAFGMGVDKKDVGLVVHYDISDSLENYVQEAGRAGRDPSLNAQCYVLYNDDDLDKHFIFLNQTKLSISEIQQVWRAIKNFTKKRSTINCSALEIARSAGWDDSVSDIETRVRTAVSALEQSGYIERGNNIPHVFATGITVKNMEEARKRITASMLFESKEIENAVRIMSSLISQKYIAKAQDAEAESRVDYLADTLGITKREVISVVERMRQEGILADSKDISAYLADEGDTEHKALLMLERFAKLEQYILQQIPDKALHISCKQLNENALSNGITTAKEKDIRTLLYFLTIKGYTRKKEDPNHNMELRRLLDEDTIIRRFEKRLIVSRVAIEWLYKLAVDTEKSGKQGKAVQFSVVALLEHIKAGQQQLFTNIDEFTLEDVEEALLYLSKIGALKLEGGFLVLYNAMSIKRLKEVKLSYKKGDYQLLNEFYKQKMQQIHIVGEYANLMVKDYSAALQYVQDYFQMDYKKFISKYFKEERLIEIERNLTPQKYKKLFNELSARQMEIIKDNLSRCIVVAAGPGSGKTRVLVHKLASLLLQEDVKHEQLLMLTFSRVAATEFKQRLMQLIGNAAHFVEIKTFHSYCFDLLGRIGNIEDVKDVVAKAAELIKEGEVEPNKIGKTVLVIDEAQDMGEAEYSLVKAMMDYNEELRVIAVGDDDQNIFDFRGSDSKYMEKLKNNKNSQLYEMTENYRCASHIVQFANSFVRSISHRMKVTPIKSMTQSEGTVSVTHYTCKYMYQPLVEDVIQRQCKGSTCILTQTNEEAVILTALLRRHGINSKLIQSMDSFAFWKMAEVRYFLKCIQKQVTTPIIPPELWEKAKQATCQYYCKSECLVYIKRCIELFEQTNPTLYYNDFKEFVYESAVEDFCNFSINDVVVSTIHKAKGREFDNVFMLINNQHAMNNSNLRRLYVGITRAKKILSIHTNSNCFDGLPSDSNIVNKHPYSLPKEIVLQLTHKDVNLSFFKQRKKDVLRLRSGDSLTYSNAVLYANNASVAQLSQKMRQTLSEWAEKGYQVKSASAHFIVSWKPKDAPKNEEETAVLLADLTLQSMNN